MKKLLLFSFYLLLFTFAWSQDTILWCDFDHSSDTAGWQLLNDGQPNYWTIGTAPGMSSGGLYITNTGDSNTYNPGLRSVVYAYRRVVLPRGAYRVSYDWRCQGEGLLNLDFLRVFLIPNTVSLVAGVTPGHNIPEGSFLPDYEPFDGSSPLMGSSSWSTFDANFFVAETDTFKLVFLWFNMGYGGTGQLPAAVDNVLIVRPACPMPAWPYVDSVTSTSFDLHWTDLSGGNATEWLVELDSATQTYGQGVQYNSYDTILSITDLEPNTEYAVYLRSVCSGVGITDTVSVRVRTECGLITSLPYVEDFEAVAYATLPYCWQLFGDGEEVLVTAHRLQWTPRNAPYQYLVLPGVGIPVSSLQLSFRGLFYASFDGVITIEVGVMTNPANPASFEPVGRVSISSPDWEQYVVDFGDYSGSGNYIAMRAYDDGMGYTVGFLQLDDFVIGRAVCQPVSNLSVSHRGTTGARVGWRVYDGWLAAPDDYEVRVEQVDSATTVSPTAPPDGCLRLDCEEPHCVLSGLSSGTDYRVWVRAHCVNDSLSRWDTVRFRTLPMPCEQIDPSTADTVPIGTGTNRVSGVPVSFPYVHSLCQSIYTAAELRAQGMEAGLITGIDYTFTYAEHDMQFSIFVSTTDLNNYPSQYYMTTVLPQHLVYGPALHPAGTSGTVHYTFDTPFSWDGTSNLVVTTIINNGSSVIQYAGFYGNSTLTGVNSTINGYSNDQPYSVDNIASHRYSTSQYRPTVVFHTAQCGVTMACVPPTVEVEQVEADGAYIEWSAGNSEELWTLCYRPVPDSVTTSMDTAWTVVDTNIDTNRYYLMGLAPHSTYEVCVLPQCGYDNNHQSFYWDARHRAVFTTACTPVDAFPWTEDFEALYIPRSSDHEVGPCWYRHHRSCLLYIVSDHANSGRSSLCYNASGNNGRGYIVLPPIGMDVSGLQVNFYAYAMGGVSDYHYQLAVGVMDDPADMGSFAAVAMVSPTAPNVWEEKEVTLDSYTGQGRYIALVMLGSGTMYIDDLTVDSISLCRRPRNVTVDRITRSMAVVQWDGRGVRNYEVEYGPAGFELGTGTVISTVYDSATLFGLSQSTRYDLYVRGICGDDTSLRSIVTTFSTLCGDIDSLPYIEDFSHLGVDNGDRPTCWQCGGFDGRPYVVNAVDGHGRPHGKALYMPSDYYQRTYAILPAADSARYPVGSLQVVVEAHCAINNSSYSHHLTVGVCQTEGDITSFTPLDTIELTIEPTLYAVPLTRAAGIGDYVTFISTPMGGSYYNTLFLDSVVLMPIPSCQVPYGLSATSPSATTAALTWSEHGTATEWQVEYMPQGMPLGTGTRLLASSTSLMLISLTPASAYDFYVRSICDTGDTSDWCYAPGRFVTRQIPAAVPYTYNGDSAAEWGNWQTLSNSPVGWYRGMADGSPAPSIYLSADSGRSHSIYTDGVLNAVAYRDIDFGSGDTSFVLSFSASMDWSLNREGLAVFFADPATTPALLYDIDGQSPWGFWDTLTLVADLRAVTDWADYSITLDSIHGTRRLVFYAHGRGAPSGSAAAVDNISIQYAPCQRPYSVRAVGVTVASATVLWHGSSTADYHVRLYNTDDNLLADDTVHTNSIQYLTLVPSTTFKVRVGRLCDGSETEAADICLFSTPACMEGIVDTVGSQVGAVSKVDVPLHISYTYSYTQQIIRASELQGRGEITAINFLYDSPYQLSCKTNCTIYLGHTHINSFTTTGDFVPPDSLQAVYIGPLNCSQGWNRILLGAPFAYNGTDNLVIVVDDNASSNHYSQHHFAASATSYPMTLSFFGYNNVDCSSSTALALYTGGREVRNYRSVLTVEMCPPNPCRPPRLLTPRIGADTVTLRWQGGADRYLFGYRRAASDRWIEDNVPLTDTFYTIGRFVYGDDYVYHVRQYCDTASVSNWAIGSFNTGALPCLPPLGLRAYDITNHTAHLAWTPDGNHISYSLHLWGGGIDTVLTRYIANAVVDGLNPGARYHAAVQVQCEYLPQPSEWSDTISFTTIRCPDATGLTALEVYGNSVLLDWQCGEDVARWIVEWGLQGFDQGTGITDTANHHPFLLTGLTGETTYDILVRSICGDDYISEGWSDRLTVTTAYSGIETDTLTHSPNNTFTIHPNPTSGDVLLTLPADIGAVRVEVVDMAGRTLQTYTLPAHTDRATLATSRLPQGAYYVRLTSDRLTAVRKLLKTSYIKN